MLEGMETLKEDYYAEAHAVAGRLRAEGFLVWAERLEGHIAGGSTSGEILMGLRHELRRAVEREKDLSYLLREEMKALAARIDAALR